MTNIINALNMENRKWVSLKYECVNECPRCKTTLLPHGISAVINHTYATVLNFCPKCKSSFITTYDNVYSDIVNDYDYSTRCLGVSEPITFVGESFSDYISSLSPNFVEIYNQSKHAETMGLNQIAGMGYRKALEFLVKDYAIKNNPDKQSEIAPMFLSVCIRDYIDNPKIKTLAEKSTWIGNDETHYVKVRTDRDVNDLKKFINACASYIEMELTVDDANSILKV